MKDHLDEHAEGAPVEKLLTLPYPTFIRDAEVPWRPWVMEGVEYKLWRVDTMNNGFTISLKVEAGTKAPVHHHLGAIDVYVISGSIYYEKSDIGHAGDVMLEPAGDIHRPVTDEGCELFCVFYGPIAGYDEEGNMAGIVDGKTMRAMAEAHGVAGHLDRHHH